MVGGREVVKVAGGGGGGGQLLSRCLYARVRLNSFRVQLFSVRLYSLREPILCNVYKLIVSTIN